MFSTIFLKNGRFWRMLSFFIYTPVFYYFGELPLVCVIFELFTLLPFLGLSRPKCSLSFFSLIFCILQLQLNGFPYLARRPVLLSVSQAFPGTFFLSLLPNRRVGPLFRWIVMPCLGILSCLLSLGALSLLQFGGLSNQTCRSVALSFKFLLVIPALGFRIRFSIRWLS